MDHHGRTRNQLFYNKARDYLVQYSLAYGLVFPGLTIWLF